MILGKSFWGPPNLPSGIAAILTRAAQKAAKESRFVKLIAEDLWFDIEARPGGTVLQGLKDFDKRFGPKFAEFYR